ncbi:sugar transferase [Parablastomonas sp. CN1-191]|uniref:sugar transferase n=1 Tax=Parablastomonas sp. CN1-191 TaxID=3400908 RepID=UPI003BF8603F
MLKRAFDIVVSAAALVVLSPLLGVTALLVRRRLGSPVLFRQQRPGLGGKPFRLVKFRSMTDARDAAGNLLPDGDRLPPFGRWLRATSIDELPELWNVLRGDMSLVGPRPLLMQYLPLYSPEQARRHEVRPGLTGFAQVEGRNALTWDQKFAADVWYVDNRGFWLDLKILWRTAAMVLKREGISAAGEATMPPFSGS